MFADDEAVVTEEGREWAVCVDRFCGLIKST